MSGPNIAGIGNGGISLGSSSGSFAVVGSDSTIVAMQAMGANLKAQPIGQTVRMITSTGNLASGVAYAVGIYLPSPAVITGVRYLASSTPNYTANNYNGVALYSWNAGTMVQLASSTTTGFTATTGTFGTVAFTATYSAAAGLYYALINYNASAVTTAPAVGTCPAVQTGAQLIGTNSSFFFGQLTATSLASSYAASSAVTVLNSASFWLGLY